MAQISGWHLKDLCENPREGRDFIAAQIDDQRVEKAEHDRRYRARVQHEHMRQRGEKHRRDEQRAAERDQSLMQSPGSS